MNDYQHMMEHIRPPERLNDRVLSAARQQEAPIPRTKKRQPVWRAAVCAALALALVAGGVSLRPAEQTGETIRHEEVPIIPEVTYHFGLTAYAADTGETMRPNANGGLAFLSAGERLLSAKDGYFTGCLFRIEGEGIKTVTVSVDRGGLYREISTQDKIVLGDCFTAVYDPDALYGFWVSPDYIPDYVKKDLRRADTRGMLDTFDGGTLEIEITDENGVSQSRIYRLSTDRLKMSWGEDGEIALLPELASENMEGIYGIYGVPEESRWLHWPVESANTVSLSNPYGYRWNPGGENQTFHAGIDIPAEQGTPITAAAAGTVTEAEFDVDNGNYIVLDHGNGMETIYAHCLSLAVEVGDTVEAGQEIAAVGSTGMSTGPHLHFEVRQDGEAQNPVAYFDSDIRDTLKMG